MTCRSSLFRQRFVLWKTELSWFRDQLSQSRYSRARSGFKDLQRSPDRAWLRMYRSSTFPIVRGEGLGQFDGLPRHPLLRALGSHFFRRRGCIINGLFSANRVKARLVSDSKCGTKSSGLCFSPRCAMTAIFIGGPNISNFQYFSCQNLRP